MIELEIETGSLNLVKLVLNHVVPVWKLNSAPNVYSRIQRFIFIEHVYTAFR